MSYAAYHEYAKLFPSEKSANAVALKLKEKFPDYNFEPLQLQRLQKTFV